MRPSFCLVACLALAANVFPAEGGKDAGGKKQAGSPLPEGDAGIAAKHPGDAGIGKDPAVVFSEDFENAGGPDRLRPKWSEVKAAAIMSFAKEVPPGSAGKRSLLMTHVAGKGTGGHLYKSLDRGYEKIHLRFYTRIDRDCFPIHHFVHMGGYDPPTRWPQGGAGVRPRGDRRFSTAVEPHGKSWVWDYYTYWMEMRGSPPRGQTWGNAFVRDPALSVRRGEWTCLELMVRLNDPGDRNGEQALWIDGKLVSHLGMGLPRGKWVYDKFLPGQGGTSVRWNDKEGKGETTQVPPGGLPFEGFRWRTTSDLKINYVWLLLYITGAPEGRVSRVWFDDLVVAKEYIGPISRKKRE